MNWHDRTIETYDQSAKQLAEYFSGIGSRVQDIEKGIELTYRDPATLRVVEIGCGDGRDAEEIVKSVGWYEGFDPSEGLLAIAKKKLPNTNFIKADASSYDYPENINLYFAFASLLHVNKIDLSQVFDKVGASLRKGGIFYISLKERPEYTEETKKDEYGERMFYYYNPEVIRRLAGLSFTSVLEEHQKISSTDWFTLALQKQ
jgi:ubiquinone/menaquinone biosynthesis C-methylase UbiE